MLGCLQLPVYIYVYIVLLFVDFNKPYHICKDSPDYLIDSYGGWSTIEAGALLQLCHFGNEL